MLVRGARQLLTLRGAPGPRRGPQLSDLGLVADGAILIVDGVVQESGPARRIENLAAARRAVELDVSGKVVLPAFVDPFTFIQGLPVRGSDYDAALSAPVRTLAVERRIEEALTRHRRQASGGKLAFHSARVLQEMVRHGIGAIEIHSGVGIDESPGSKYLRTTARRVGIPLDVTHSLLIGHPGLQEFNGLEEDYVRWVSDVLLPRHVRRDSADAAAICLGFGVLDAGQAYDCLAAAGRSGLRLSVIRGPEDDGAAVELALRTRCAALAGLSNLAPSALEALAGSSTAAVLRPMLHWHQWRGAEPARELVARGAAIALSTGWHPVFAPSASMPTVISLACSAYGLRTAEAISAATVNAAYAMGLLGSHGSLEPGKQGNFLVLSAPDYRDLPVTLGVNPVEAVVKRGAVVWQKSNVEWP